MQKKISMDKQEIAQGLSPFVMMDFVECSESGNWFPDPSLYKQVDKRANNGILYGDRENH